MNAPVRLFDRDLALERAWQDYAAHMHRACSDRELVDDPAYVEQAQVLLDRWRVLCLQTEPAE